MITVLRGGRIPPSRQRRSLALAGIALIAMMIGSVVLVFAAWLGGGITDVRVTADIMRGGDALQAGDEVRYRDVVVGAVAATGAVKPDVIQLELRISPDQARMIPANVMSRALPTTIFGAQYVDLVPPQSESPGHLSGGATLQADRRPGTAELQTAFIELNRLLLAVHPAKLDAALTAFATALQGQGAQIGALIDELDAYLRQVAPTTPQLQDNITHLANVTEALSRDAPELLRSLANGIVTANTITEKQAELRSLIAGSIVVTDDSTAFVTQTRADYTAYVLDLNPVLAVVDRNTGNLTNGTVQLDNWFKSWGLALKGKFVKLNLLFKNVNGPALVAASLAPPGAGKAQADQAFAAELNPPPYTAVDCPRYPGASGPNCPTGSHATPADATAAPPVGGTVGPAGSAQEQEAVGQLLSLTGGGQAVQMPGLSDLLIGPLIRGAVVGVK